MRGVDGPSRKAIAQSVFKKKKYQPGSVGVPEEPQANCGAGLWGGGRSHITQKNKAEKNQG